MTQNQADAFDAFQDEVAVKFQLYNSLFLSLPYDRIEKTGILLSLFLTHCEEGFQANKATPEIVDDFFNHHASIASETENGPTAVSGPRLRTLSVQSKEAPATGDPLCDLMIRTSAESTRVDAVAIRSP